MPMNNAPESARGHCMCRSRSGASAGTLKSTSRRSLPVLAVTAFLVTQIAGCDWVQSRIIKRMAGRALNGDRTDLLTDGDLHVVLCGTGSPVADPERASACTAVLAGGHFLLVDAGPGSSRQVAVERLPRARLEALLLTHFHSDHIGEVGEATLQSWVAGRTNPLAVYGPPGVQQVVDGFREAYTFDTQYRVAHHGAEAMPPAAGVPVAKVVTLPGSGEAAVVFDADGLRVTAFAVDHQPVEPAYGYRFDYHGRSVVISGDTKKSANLIRHAQGADILVHEALAKQMIAPVIEYAKENGLSRWAKLTSDVGTYHTSPIEAAETAKAANVRMLVLTHIVPPLANYLARRMFLRGVSSAWDGSVELGYDGMHLKMAPGTEAIQVDSFG
jgi:ribonuclease Z